ncbi:nuclear transport factor 2 family protein [Rhizobiaceae sp. 2RAB30]
MDVDERLGKLEAKVAELTDHIAILQLVASYGPAVDSLDRDGVHALWAEDGSYDFGGIPLVGREAVASLIDLDTHRAYVDAGSAHTLSLPRIDIDGDRAVAVNYSQIFVKDGSGWRVERTSANRWHLVRTQHGWAVEERTNRPLDGSQPPRDLLRRHRPNEVGAAAEPNA